MRTHRDFEYILFVVEEKYYVKIKETQEVIEVENKVFCFLRSEGMKVYRYSLGIPFYRLVEGKWRKEGYRSLILMDSEIERKVIHDGLERHVFFKLEIEYFMKHLTKHQLDVFKHCMLNQLSIRSYAREHGLHKSSVEETIRNIRKKYKKIMKDPRHL